MPHRTSFALYTLLLSSFKSLDNKDIFKLLAVSKSAAYLKVCEEFAYKADAKIFNYIHFELAVICSAAMNNLTTYIRRKFACKE